ncbi:hypothetical protein ACFL5F_02795 [Planctomycetota bacterium]
MNNKFSSIAVTAALSILAIVISGCNSRISLVEQGIASVETKPSKNVEILWTDVFRDGNEIIVYGVVRRRHHTIYPLKTHVDATILTPDGKVLREAHTPDIYVPRFVPGKGINFKRFEIRFPDMPGNFSVKAAVHSE